MRKGTCLAVVALVIGAAPFPAFAQKLPAPDPLALLNSGSFDALGGNLRGYLVRNLPSPLFEKSTNWGHQEYVRRGIEWHGLRPELQRSHKNDGVWQKVHVVADNPTENLVVHLSNLATPEEGRMTFQAFLAFDVRVIYDRQRWERGLKLFDGTVRARFRLKLTTSCEATAHLEPSGKLLPDAVIRFRVTESHLSYDNFVAEHVAGIGGEAAKLLGDLARGGLHRLHPSLERDLLDRADAAIIKAAGTREVRVNLAALLTKKGKIVTTPKR